MGGASQAERMGFQMKTEEFGCSICIWTQRADTQALPPRGSTHWWPSLKVVFLYCKLPHRLSRAAPTSSARRFHFRCSSPSPSVLFWGCTWSPPSSPWSSPEPSPLRKTRPCGRDRGDTWVLLHMRWGNIDTENLSRVGTYRALRGRQARVHKQHIVNIY